MARLTGLWWWIDRWRKSTAYTDMSLEEQGAYRNLLDEAWLRQGCLPNNENALAKACGDPRRWSKVRTAVMAHFVLGADDCWHNETLDEVAAKSEAISSERSRAGLEGNRRRWGDRKPVANGIANASQTASQNGRKDGRKTVANTIAPDPDPDPDPEYVRNQLVPATSTRSPVWK